MLQHSFHWIGRAATLACALAGVSLAVPASWPAAQADQTTATGLQAQADQLASQLAAQASRIHSLDVQLAQAQQRVNGTSNQLAGAQADMAKAERDVAASELKLHAQAVAAYLQGGTATDISIVVDNNPSEILVRREYLSVAAGDTSDVIDRLHLEKEALAVRQAALISARKAEQQAALAVSQSRQAATVEVSATASTLAGVNTQLAGLVAQAAAVQAIAASGSRHPAARAGGGGGAQGLPTAAGLRSVIGAPSGGGSLGSQLAALRQCEAGGNYSTDTGNGYYGAYQISQSTWESLGYSGLPSDAPAGVQDQAAATLQARSGWGQWPTCSSILGL